MIDGKLILNVVVGVLLGKLITSLAGNALTSRTSS